MAELNLSNLVDQYGAALRELEAAQAAHDAARDAIHSHLEDLGRAYVDSGERQIEIAVAQHLYWNLPKIHAKAIGAALGVYATDVHKVLSAEAYTVECQGCGAVVERRPKSRTTDSGGRYGACAQCIHERMRRNDDERRERAQKDREDEVHRIGLIRAGGYWIDSEGEVVAAGVQRWCWGCGGGSRPHVESWEVGATVTYECHECHDVKPWAEPRRTLVSYVRRTGGAS